MPGPERGSRPIGDAGPWSPGRPRRPRPVFSELTKRELHVLHLMTAGRSNHEIGAELHLTPKTVRNYVLSILTKLGVRDRTQAVIRARDAGLS